MESEFRIPNASSPTCQVKANGKATRLSMTAVLFTIQKGAATRMQVYQL